MGNEILHIFVEPLIDLRPGKFSITDENLRCDGFIWVFDDTRFCQIIWQIWSYTEQNKFRQNCPQWDLNWEVL